MASLLVSVKSKDSELVGRLFSAKIIELALANIPGFFAQGGVKSSGPIIVYWPALVDSKHIKEFVHINDKDIEIISSSQLEFEEIFSMHYDYTFCTTTDFRDCVLPQLPKKIQVSKMENSVWRVMFFPFKKCGFRGVTTTRVT